MFLSTFSNVNKHLEYIESYTNPSYVAGEIYKNIMLYNGLMITATVVEEYSMKNIR